MKTTTRLVRAVWAALCRPEARKAELILARIVVAALAAKFGLDLKGAI